MYSLDASGIIGVTNNLVNEFNSDEDRAVGDISCSTLHIFARALGGYKMIIFLMLSSFASYSFTMYSSKFLEDWSKDFEGSDKFHNLWVYCLLWLFYK